MKTTNKKQDAFIASLMPDSDKKMVRIASLSLIVALALGFWATTYERVIDEVLFDTPDSITVAKVTMADPAKKPEEKKPETKKNKPVASEHRKRQGGGGKPSGKGRKDAALERGVLKILTALKNNSAAEAFVALNQKTAKDIDKVLSKVNGLQTHGTTKLGGRRGAPNRGFNEAAFAGGAGGIGDALGGLVGGSAGPLETKAMKGHIKAPNPNEIDMGAGGGSRSASDIMKVVRQRTPGLRHIYNKHLKKNPGFQGKVTLRFTIAPGGEIINMALVSSTTGYSAFDSDIKNAVAKWTFGVIKSGNTTVTIPFTFTE